VEAAGLAGMRGKRNPMRVSPTDFFTTTEQLRTEFAKLIGSTDSNRIVLIPAASYGLANAMANIRLSAGDKVIVASEQFPSNYYPWERLCSDQRGTLIRVSPPDPLEHRGQQWNQRILEAIDNRTRVVALGHVHWADGTRFDLKAIRKRTRETGSLLIIDGTQSVGAMPFDVNEIQPDALVCAGYKWLMGPYSLGLAYYGPAFDEGRPIEENWINRKNSEDFTALVNYQEAYQPGSLRYEVGEHSNFILVPMLLEAIKQVNRWKPEAIQTYTASISRKAIVQLRNGGCWVEDEPYRGNHLFGVRVPASVDISRLKETLKKKNISVSFRGSAMRISPHVYNTATDLNRLVEAIKNTNHK
jgi:selenocysteine lyase/cysteine desulfurase